MTTASAPQEVLRPGLDDSSTTHAAASPRHRAWAAIRDAPAWLVAAALAGLYLAINPPSADLAAAIYRTWLFKHFGWTVWDTSWYAGHHIPAYSVLFPPLAALIGPRVTGALAALVAAWAFERLMAETRSPGARPAALWFATATAVSLVTGRLTFALGLALGILAVLAVTRRRIALGALLAATTALASPVAAAFLALAFVAWGGPRRRPAATAALVAATVLPALALNVAFPEGGDFPFVAEAFWPSLAATLALFAPVPRREHTLRLGLILYVMVLVGSAALSTPMGGNAVRLGALLAGPVAALALWPHRRGALLLLAPILLYWQWVSPVDDWVHAAPDASVHATYYTGLLRFLGDQTGGPFRIEIPFTDNHWEGVRVAERFPLARGWERQLDRKVNGLFYDGRPLTATRYRRWLEVNAIRFVALPDAPIDYSGAAEAALVRRRPSYLHEVWHDAHWQVFAVRAPTPLAEGAGGARVTAMHAGTVDLVAPQAGVIHLRVRWSPYWRLARGSGCVRRSGDWTTLVIRRPGALRLAADFSLWRVRASGARCSA